MGHSIETALQIGLLHVEGITEVLEVVERIEIAAPIFTLVHKVHLITTLEVCVQQVSIVGGVDELCIVTVVKQVDDVFH